MAEKQTDAELLAWAAAIINREQGNQTYGTVTVHLQAGRIVRAAVERIETPANGNKPAPSPPITL